jgi:hypothetical protein
MPIRDREKPRGSPLPHHRTNGSRIRRFGRLSQCAKQTAHARQPERHFPPRQRRLHPSHRAYAPRARRMQCRRSLASDFSSLLLPSRGTVRAFDGSPPTMPFADFFLAVRGNRSPLSQFLPHAESQGTRKTSRGKTQNVPRVDAEFIKHTPTGRWRTSRSRARSSRVYHTSDPVRIPRPALLDWASFRPHLTMTPLPFS